MTNLDSILKSRDITLPTKGLPCRSYHFSSSHVCVWELDHKESWAPKNWCFWTMVLEKTLKSLLDSKEIKSVHPKGNQSWIFIGRTDACWGPAWGTPPMAKVIRKEAWHTQRHDQASGNPLFPSIHPQNQSTLRGLSPITISLREGVNLQLWLIKIPARDKSVST